ncbi:isocitrate/isopropylmalate dehydrogenase family protein [Pseudosulfitobacter koreensis]|uniref:Isocitrate/isopropylmalate family dehydrogenase n=1 Tax=Pseudosulfitobacter koreensis TaxID=2968472 RepID=A0ABT1Z067_9RHOB|nr:isocitrate/isopropylmalate family dehydrogenase [Pseudosulfitobacter koreense]MCR8826535.1 isocitrate/isopropylmalate family dehydrogenase [Pseudosulfitobacter koreense]
MNKKILVLPGDGIGVEVCDAALPVFDLLDLPVDLAFGDIGWECWKTGGDPVPQRTWDQIAQSDAVLLGAITSKPKAAAEAELPPHLQGQQHKFVSPVIQLRQKLGLYANVRPASNIKGEGVPFRLAVIRENTEGLYAGYDYRGIPAPLRELVSHPNLDVYGPDEASCTLRLQTRFGLERLFRFAFEHAVAQGFDKVTFADKPNVMRESGAFAKEILEQISADYPGVTHEIHNVDAIALWLVRRPESFGVIVAENMFGDILSDLAGGVMGGLGLAPSGNYGDHGAYFEPVHGSAPKMAGLGRGSPAAMFLSIAMTLEYLGFQAEADLITTSLTDCVRQPGARTYDLGGTATTLEFAARILNQIETRSARLATV